MSAEFPEVRLDPVDGKARFCPSKNFYLMTWD